MASAQPKLLFPGLAGFYAAVGPAAYTFVRAVVGIIMVVHGWGKVTGPGPSGVATMFGRLALPMADLLAYIAIFLEVVGGACLVIGLLTRFFAAGLAIEMLIALLTVHWAKGFMVNQGGYEFVLLIGAVLFAIAIRGGGPWSVDAKIGKEL
ncbi:MAG: DoxX family protein [Pseudolabrys sp.]|nr:DoxX family protein [Pseudolabrys sp.]